MTLDYKNLQPRVRDLAVRIEKFYNAGYGWGEAARLAGVTHHHVRTERKINNTTRQKAIHTTKTDPVPTCSFCSKKRSEVFKIIAGPEVTICDECVELCVEIITEEKPSLNTQQQALDQVISEIELAQKHGQQCVPVSSLFWAMHATG